MTDQNDLHRHSKSRDFAAQFLYQCESQKQFFYDDPRFRAFCGHFDVPVESISYLRKIVSRVFESLNEIDELIASKSQNWKISRMAQMDRVILRIAVAELLEKEAPPKVILNEAIELAKRYGSEVSGGFVNGILDALMHSINEESSHGN